MLPEALLGSIRLNHLDLSVAQYLDTAIGELLPRQTPAQRRCGPEGTRWQGLGFRCAVRKRMLLSKPHQAGTRVRRA